MSELTAPRWTSSRLALVAVLGAINGVVTTPLAFAWTAINNAFGIIGAAAFQPMVIFQILAGILVPIRGVYLLAGTISGLANFLSGDPNGLAALYWGVAGGVAGEVALALFRWDPRKRIAIAIAAGLLYIPATNVVTFFLYGWSVDALFWIGVVVSLIAITVESTLPAIGLARWIRSTGLLRSSMFVGEPTSAPPAAEGQAA